MTAVDIAAGNAVAADNDDAVNDVVPPSSTKDEDACVGASVVFGGACVGAFADGPLPPTSRCCAAATTTASVLLPRQEKG